MIGRVSIPASLASRLDGVEPVEVPERVETPAEAAERLAAATAWRPEQWRRHLPARYAHAAVEDLAPEQDPRGKVSSWLASGHQTLILWSTEPGLGKSHAMYAIGNAAVQAGLWARAWPVIGLLDDLRPSGDPTAHRCALHCDVLGLDDLGKEADVSPWVRERLHGLISDRLAEGRRLVVTTNLGGNAMVDRYAQPFVDRLVDDAVIVEVTGSTYRKPAPW